MNPAKQQHRSLWITEKEAGVVKVIDQRFLPHKLVVEDLASVDDVVRAISEMHVRGAGLIGVAAGFGIYLAALHGPRDDSFDRHLDSASKKLKETRPTAANLAWAVDRTLKEIRTGGSPAEKIRIAFDAAEKIMLEELENCRMIGVHGLELIREISERKNGETVNILTHCNAGFLAFVDHGSATAPIYAALEEGIDLHVWIDETRPWNQGSRLTAWEMSERGVPHTIITDNMGGHLMQHGMVDIVIVGSDRTTFTGDVANKAGTYLKALAARDNGVPFYVALTVSSFDWKIEDGVSRIPIEMRSGDEVRYARGLYGDDIVDVLIAPQGSKALNYSFDITPARLVTGLITERGVCAAEREGILGLYPEKRPPVGGRQPGLPAPD